jgi:hypothetical protein
MTEWDIGHFKFAYFAAEGELEAWFGTDRLATESVPVNNLDAAKVAAATWLLKFLNTTKYRLFEYLKDLDIGKLVGKG